MDDKRRGFIKKVATTGAIATTASAAGLTSVYGRGKKNTEQSGVVIGKSNKKEILYKDTKAWNEYYKRAL